MVQERPEEHRRINFGRNMKNEIWRKKAKLEIEQTRYLSTSTHQRGSVETTRVTSRHCHRMLCIRTCADPLLVEGARAVRRRACLRSPSLPQSPMHPPEPAASRRVRRALARLPGRVQSAVRLRQVRARPPPRGQGAGSRARRVASRAAAHVRTAARAAGHGLSRPRRRRGCR